MYFNLQFQRANQIRSVPFTGDSSDSDSDGDLGVGGAHGLDGLGGLGADHGNHMTMTGNGNLTLTNNRVSSRNTTTTTTTITSSTSGDISLSSPRGLTGNGGQQLTKQPTNQFKSSVMLCPPPHAHHPPTNKLGTCTKCMHLPYNHTT